MRDRTPAGGRPSAGGRAVSTPLAYVLNLGIATVLITGLVVGGTAFVEDNRETVVRTELRVIGQQLAADLQQADRLVEAHTASSNPTVAVEQRYPGAVAGSAYTVKLVETTSPARQFVNLTTSGSNEVSVAVRVPTKTPIEDGSATNGGRVVVRYADTDGDNTKDALVVEDAS
jgi:hypothetical protein